MSTRLDFTALWGHIRGAPNRTFIQSPLGSVSYGQLTQIIGRFCAAFDREGVIPGSRVVIVSANEPVAGAAFLAALLDGLVPVMLSPDSRPDRVNAICTSVEPGMLIADAAVVDAFVASDLDTPTVIPVPTSCRLEKSRPGLSAVWGKITRSSPSSAVEEALMLPTGGREPRLPGADETAAYILFTSGTTKAPSGVLISRNSLMAQLETLTRLFDYDIHSRIFNATPLAHTDGLVQGLLLAAGNGATLLRPGPFLLSKLEEWLNSLSSLEATHFITNPTTLTLIDRFAAHDDYFDGPGFFGILSSASILRPSLWEKFEARFDCQLYNMYGMTETVANATYAGRHPEMGPVGTIGIPVDCEVRLVDTGPARPGQISVGEGELQVRGENIFLGYWKDPDRTTQTLISDGWMRTGDLARQRIGGGLEIVGRIKTMINMGGQSVMPEEIDEVLATHDAVVDVATVGISDPQFEEVAVSAVALERATSEAELTEYCRQHLERLKVPKRILAVEKIPRGDAGKPLIGELQALLAPMLEDNVPATAIDENSGPVSEEAVYALAATVFRVPVAQLSADSSPATVPGWDSFTHLSLVIETELRFGINIPASRIASIRSLGDLHQSITARQ